MNKILVLPALALVASCGAGNGDNPSSLLSSSVVSQQAAAAPGSAAVDQAAAPEATIAILDDPALPAADFLVRAYQDGIGEIALSTLIAERAADASVRRYATMLAADHTQANQRIAQLAQAQNITLPTTPTADQVNVQNRLSSLSGADVDREYLAHNAVVHEQSTLRFMQQAQTGSDAQTRMLALNMLPVLKTHLAMTEELYASVDASAYLMTAYRHGLAEVLWSQTALTRSTDPGVRAFAQMMVDQHTSANAQITSLAQARGIVLPAGPSLVEQAKNEDLARLSAADFDKAYMNENVIVHTGDVNATRAQAENGADQDVRNLAMVASTALTGHLTMSMELYARLDTSFLAGAFLKNAGEILLAHRALENAVSSQVQGYARDMVADHTAANNEVIMLAEQEAVPLPKAVPAEFFLVHRFLARASEEDFDRAYMLLNVEAHERAISFYQSRAQNEPDPEQRAYAAQKLPALQAHLDNARQISQSLPVPPDSMFGRLLDALQ